MRWWGTSRESEIDSSKPFFSARYLELRSDSYRAGTGDAGAVLDAARAVGDIKRDLAANKDEQIKVTKQSIELLKMAEQRLKEQFEAGVTTEANVLKTRLAREATEIELMKLEGKK